MTASCEHCGTANRDGANFCIGCAARLPGFAPTGPSALQLLRGKEADAAAAAQRARPAAHAGGVGAAVWLRWLLAAGLLLMGAFVAWYLHVVRQTSTPQAVHAGVPVVQQQPAYLQLGPLESDVLALPGVSQAARAAAARSAKGQAEASAAPLAAPQRPASAPETVAQFYQALSSGDGASASAFVIASKRGQGPLSGDAMSTFYRSLEEPLSLRSVRQIDAQRVEARYAYRAARTRCEGRALVTMESPQPGAAIRSIAANC